MEDLLIRTLSTGRTGTKFLSAAFSDQGYKAFHENLYEGEPSSAIIHYCRMLGDLWSSNKERYYSFESDFVHPYIAAALECIRPEIKSEKNAGLKKWRDRFLTEQEGKSHERVLVHTGHRLTPATPLIEKEAKKQNIQVKTIVLYRNPLKTIHAIYMVESAPSGDSGPYRNRPSTFFNDGSFLGAAQIWANTYLMCLDQSEHSRFGKFIFLDLDRFSQDVLYAEKIFKSLGLELRAEGFQNFVRKTLDQPLRASKTNSVRNSHIFHDPDYYFADDEISQIYLLIKDALNPYDLEWGQVVDEYQAFHQREKRQIGIG